jgi:hypothetical protein
MRSVNLRRLDMAYNIYKGDKLHAVCRDEMGAVSAAVTYYRATTLPITVEEVHLDGSTSPYDWEKSYRELCNQ